MTTSIPSIKRVPTPLTDEQATAIYAMLHPAEEAMKKKGLPYYRPLYTALHQTKRWCGNPACYRPVNPDIECKLCGTQCCGKKCFTIIHKGKEGVKPDKEKLVSGCGIFNQTISIRNYLNHVFLVSPDPDENLTIFKEYRVIQVLEEWLTQIIFHGANYNILSTLTKEEMMEKSKHVPLEEFVEVMGEDIRGVGMDIPYRGTRQTRMFFCGCENVHQELSGMILTIYMAIEILHNSEARAQLIMTAVGMVHASRPLDKFNKIPFIGVSMNLPDAIRPEFITDQALASPLAIYQSDQKLKWPAYYYTFMLVPLNMPNVVVRRSMQFCVGLYVTTKDALVIASAGTELTGFGILSLLRAHASSDANPHVNHKAFGAQPHMTPNDTERWIKRLEGLTIPDVSESDAENGSSTAGREAIIRELLAIDKKVKYPVPFPVYRIVTSRVIVNIV